MALSLLSRTFEKENADNLGKDGFTADKRSKDKWVVNLSSRKLTQPEVNVLERGLNFAVSPESLPINDIVVATESACKQIANDKAAELRARVVNIAKNAKPPVSNINKAERSAVESLKKDTSIQILPADKGRATVVIDNSVYEEKALALLQDESVYETLKKDPTQKFQSRLIKLLKELKETGAITSKTYWDLYPTVADVPRFYGLIKIHKAEAPLRPIVSSIGAVTYNLARFVADIISPLIGKTEHHIVNSQAFVNQIKDLKVEPDESIVSFDVSALFTSIPVKEALVVVRSLLENDETWKVGTAEDLEVDDIINLLNFCLSTTYFVFREKYYQQKDGCAMGSPCSPLVANAYMEYFEKRALSSAPHPPRMWVRYVDDTFCVIKTSHVDEFTDHINSQDNNIKFTREEEEDGQLPFLDTLIVRASDGSVKVKIFRKPTHTDQYLSFASHHPLEHKLSVIKTLLYRSEIVTDPEDRAEEIEHCGYRDWTFFRAQEKREKSASQDEPDSETSRGFTITLPYLEGTSEQLRRAFKTAGVPTAFKPYRTLRQTLVSPKDKVDKLKQSGTVYEISCSDCDAMYIGETGRKLEKRLSEHKSKAAGSKSAVHEHISRSKTPIK
ncbi:uncharacterized protein [Amphiura filiformis]|uniref:uncharacterized protein n=1 Tax=Amphiura filiformis TaxID=82378 RepID=UPI003B213A74